MSESSFFSHQKFLQRRDTIAAWTCILSIVAIKLYLGMSWQAYSPIPYETAGFYGVDISEVNMIIVICFLIYCFSHIIAIYTADQYGPACNIYIAVFFLIPSMILRMVAATNQNRTGFRCAMASSFIAMLSGGCVTMLPAKVASIWFPESTRTIAASIAAIATEVAVMLTYALGPVFVKGSPTPAQFLALAEVTVAIGGFAMLVSLLFLWLSAWTGLPQGEPVSNSSKHIIADILAHKTLDVKSFIHFYKEGFGAFRDIRGFGLLAILTALSISLFGELIILTPEILCAFGYGKLVTNVAVPVALNVGGIIGIFFYSYITFRWNLYELVIRVLPVSCIPLIWLIRYYMISYNQEWAIIALVAVLGFLLFPTIPLCHELIVDCTFPLGAGLTTGVSEVIADILGLLTSTVVYRLSKPHATKMPSNTCHVKGDTAPLDFTNGLLMLAIGWTAGSIVFSIFYKADLRRPHVDMSLESVKHTPVEFLEYLDH